MAAINLLLVFFAWIVLSSASYLRDKHVCGKNKLCSDHKNIKFLPQNSYKYEYEAKVVTVFDVEKNNASTLFIRAQVDLAFDTACHGYLQVSDVTMADSDDDSGEILDEFSKHILKFYFEDGLFREVCPEKEEPIWVLNIKKGILSAFQNSMVRLDLDHNGIETDVNGECRTEYRLERVNGTELVIGKRKDLHSCTSRHQLLSIVPTPTYVFQTKYHKWSPMVSELSCEQRVDHNVVTGVHCDESHSFLPFPNQILGASTSAMLRLTLIEENDEGDRDLTYNVDKVERRTSLLYDTGRVSRDPTSERQAAEQLLSSMCTLDKDELEPQFSEVFNQFIHVARYLPFESLSDLYKASESLCPNGKKHLTDGLPHLRSSAAVRLMKDAILGEQLSTDTVNRFLLAIAVFNRPEAETVQAVSELVGGRTGHVPSMLAASSVVHAFCQSGGACQTNPHVRAIIDTLEDFVQQTVFPEHLMHTVIGALKALGNVGVLTPTLAENLRRVASRMDLPLELRAAAISAHRRLPCGINNDFLLKTYQNDTIEEEIRIKSYLEVMKCPSHQSIQAIRSTLLAEENNQVGSFVWSHLYNIKVSALPSLMEVQAMLQTTEFPAKFDKSFLQFSRNYESSFYINEYGVGGFIISNVIFSHKSYIPRSVSSNITIILFGEPVNLAEITLDLEGFEQYVEAVLWKNSMLNKLGKSMGIMKYLKSAHASMKSKIDALPNVIADSFAVPKASLSIKLFGNDIQYLRSTEKEEINNLLNNLNPVKIVNDFLQGQDIQLERSSVVCDARYVTPLAIGIPLNTDAIVTSTIKMELAGFINATAFTTAGQLNVQAKLKPSVAINMMGVMGADAYYKQTQAKVVSKMFTATAMAGSFKVKGYRFAKLSLDLPLKKSEIFNWTNKLVVSGLEDTEVEVGASAESRVRTRLCSWPALDRALGLTLCVRSLLPNTDLVLHSPELVFNGPLSVEITLDKSDPSTQTYVLEYNMADREDGGRVVSLVLDTPGSQVKRGLTASLALDAEADNVTLVFKTTHTQLKAQGFYRNTEDEMSLTFWLDMNNKRHIDFQMAVFSTQGTHGPIYEPKLQFFINSKRIAELSGLFKWVKKNELSQCEISLDFRTNRFTIYTNNSYIRINDVSFSTNFKLDYQFDNLKIEYVRVEMLLDDKTANQITKKSGEIKLVSSAYPQIDTIAKVEYQKGYGHLDCKTLIINRPSPNRSNKNSELEIKSRLTYQKTHDGSKATVLAEVRKADDDVDLMFDLSAKHSGLDALVIRSLIRYSKGKEITVFFDLLVPKNPLLSIDSNFNVTIPNTSNAMAVHASIRENMTLNYVVGLSAVWFSGHNVSLAGAYQDKSTYNDTVHMVSLLLSSQLFRDIALDGSLHVGDTRYKTDIDVGYNNVKYSLKLHHETPSAALMISNGEVGIDASKYTVANLIDLTKRRAALELHLAHYRDIHVRVEGPGVGQMKALLDIKWDVNRDPTQLMVAVVELTGWRLNSEITASIEYPGRTLSAMLTLRHKDSDYTALSSVQWSEHPGGTINSAAFLVLDLERSGLITLSANVQTPFENWNASRLTYGLWLQEDSLKSNASASWGADGSVLLDVTCRSLSSAQQLGFAASAQLQSTVKQLSPVSASLSYAHSPQHLHALLDIESSSAHRIRLEVGGRMAHALPVSDYSAFVQFETPFQNLSRGEISARLKMDADHIFDGSSIIALNDRNISSSVHEYVVSRWFPLLRRNGRRLRRRGKGGNSSCNDVLCSFKTLKESQLILIVHTPFQRYSEITGLFEFSTSKAHLIAELKATTFNVAFKTIYIYRSIKDFDLQLSGTTGASAVNSALLVATLNNETVDFRGGWNTVMVGLLAHSHYRGWPDLEYRGSLFLPFDGFRESGAIAKFLFTDKFHLELAAVVAKAKVGAKAVGEWHVGPVLWNSVLQLDVLQLPTMYGQLTVVRRDQFAYATTAHVQLTFVEVILHDVFVFKNQLDIGNDLTINSTHPLLSEIKSKFQLAGTWPQRVVASADLKAIISNKTYKFDAEGQYQFQPFDETGNEGIYSLSYKMTTPFQAIDHCFFTFNVQAEPNTFASNLTLDVVENRINMLGTLEVDDSIFKLTTHLNVASPSFVLPFCHISFSKDFLDEEKNISIGVKYPNKLGKPEHFEVSSSWLFKDEKLIKLAGTLMTPFEKLHNVRSSFKYEAKPEDRSHQLDLRFFNSHLAELKMSGNIIGEIFHLEIDSSFERFREVVVDGSLQRQSDGSLVLESAASLDHSMKLDLKITSSHGTPLFLLARAMDSKQAGDVELGTLTVDLRRKRVHSAVGYSLITIIRRGPLELSLEADVTSRPTDNTFNLVVTSNHERYKKISLKITTIPGKNQLFEIRIHGSTDTGPLNSNFNVICKMWFNGSNGRILADVASEPWQLAGDSYVEWEWDYLRNMRGFANASYSLKDVARDFSAHLFFRSPVASIENICFGTDLNLNNKLWWFSSNVTLLMPTLNNVAFTSFLVLPHNSNETHSLVGKLHFTDDFAYINHVLKYTASLSKLLLHSSLQVRMSDGDVEGAISVDGGTNGIYFLRDSFNATIKDHKFDLNSMFTSSFTQDDITVNMHYKKPQSVHLINVNVLSPGHAVSVVADANFETVNNVRARINCTTPLSTMPHIGLVLKVISDNHIYHRFGELVWPNNSALFNLSHFRGEVSHGSLLADFPLTTRHTLLLTYTYQEKDQLSSGNSGLTYNDNCILKGNFSRSKLISDVEHKDCIKIHVHNIYMPLGLNYQRHYKKDIGDPFKIYLDKKRIEVFKADNYTFNITGEMNLEKTKTDNTVDLNLNYSNRSLSLRTIACVNNSVLASARVTLRPDVWASTDFHLFRKNTAKEVEEQVELRLGYPRREVSVTGGYEWAEHSLRCHAGLRPGRSGLPLVATLAWTAPHNVVLQVSHPSLEKNLTVYANMRQGEGELVAVDARLEYALIKTRTLSLTGAIARGPGSGHDYGMLLVIRHPITRFHFDMTGAIEKNQGYIYAFKNVSYARYFQPLQFWNSTFLLNITNDKLIEIKRHSLRDLAYASAKYSKHGTKYNLEGNIINGKTTNISGNGFIDFHNLKSLATINLTSDASEQLLVVGDYLDNRNAFFNIWRHYDDLTVRDMSFLLRLNHSRLLTVNYLWRTSIKQDVIDGIQAASSYVWTYMTETGEFWTDFMRSELSDSLNDFWLDAEPVLQDFIDDITNVETMRSDFVYFQNVFNESYEANEFFMQDIYNITLLLAEEIAFRDKMGDLPKIVSELWQVMGETGESIRQSILYLIETMKGVYMKLVEVWEQLMQGDALQQLSQLVAKLTTKYDKMIKELHVTFVHYVESLWSQAAAALTESTNRMLQVIEPAFIEFVHYVEAVFWDFSNKIIEFLYQKQSLILSSAHLAKDSNFTKDLDRFVKDVSKNGFLISFKKYTVMVVGMLKEKYIKVIPFGYELTEITTEIYGELKELYKLPAVNFTLDTTFAVLDKTVWIYEYFNIGNKIQQALPFVYNKVIDLSHTSLQNEILNHKRKTLIVFEPRRGELRLEQKLPVPWHAFNQIPRFEEVPEYKMVTNAQKWLTPTNKTLMTWYYQYSPLADYRNWLPPYKGEALIGHNSHIVTFDGSHLTLHSSCASYLLARDFVRNDFALVLAFVDGRHVIELYVGPYVVEVDLNNDLVTIPSHDIPVPADLNGTLVFFEFGIITIESDMGFGIYCNVKYDVCTVKLTGWYFGKTAGLLGTMDNEPSTDWRGTNTDGFTRKWLLDPGKKCTPLRLPSAIPPTNATPARCDKLYASKASHFSPCFPAVDPSPYSRLCRRGATDGENDVCTSAIMYVQSCLAHNIPLRIPNDCVSCQLHRSGQIVEGDFYNIKGSEVPQSSDVVFIIEAKQCNDFNTGNKSASSIVNAISKELIEIRITDNRFAVVAFGGDGVLDEPRNLLADGHVFGNQKQATQLFSRIRPGNGNSDIFKAIRFSTKLQFRAGVSKTFILIPCSNCDINSTEIDYSALQEVLTEKHITLHILMDGDFGLEKKKSNRILYGVDAKTAYTKGDVKGLRGDPELWRQVKVRNLMPPCGAIALRTNGSLFSARKLENGNTATAKKLVSVMSKRVAVGAHPPDCQNCECAADDNGVDAIYCLRCSYSTPDFPDLEFKDNSSYFQSLEDEDNNY